VDVIYGSVCSGIEAATVAWHELGWKPAWFSEIDPFCSALLKHHYPGVRNYGDFTTIGDDAGPIDILCGGTPCQDFSVAGLRAGLGGARGNLTLEFVKLAGRLRPRWLVWENVPGVLSIDNGRAFASFLGGLAELGYGFAYGIFDAQFFGVPQRRRRVFVVGHLGNWRYPASVLFECESLSGDLAPSREAGEGFAHEIVGSLTASGRGCERTGESRGQDPVIAMCLNAHGRRMDAESETFITSGPLCANGKAAGSATQQDAESGMLITHTLSANGFDASEDGTGRGTPLVPCVSGMAVRRITPREAERLQGFEDDYTLVPYRGKPASDGPRYRAIGNSWAVPVPKWIGRRIQMVDAIVRGGLG